MGQSTHETKVQPLGRETVFSVSHASDSYYRGICDPNHGLLGLRDSSVWFLSLTLVPAVSECHSSCRWFSLKEPDEMLFMASPPSPSLPGYCIEVMFLFPRLIQLSSQFLTDVPLLS